MNDFNYQELIAQYLSGNISEDMKTQLMTWKDSSEDNKALFKEAKALWDLSADYADPFDTNVEAAWTKFEKKITPDVVNVSTQSARIRPIKTYKRILQIAAIFVIGLAGLWWFLNIDADNAGSNSNIPLAKVELEEFQTVKGEKRMYELPDGSKVWLNERSKISFDKKFETRLVNLEGEAFFEVVNLAGKQFEIKSGIAKTLVLGTSFNVRAYPQEDIIELSVKTGKVAFSNEEKPEDAVLLAAGNYAVINKDETNSTIKKSTYKLPNSISWKTEKLVFDNTPLSEVASSLERHFDIDINTLDNKILNCRLTGTYEKPDLDELFKVLDFALGIDVKKEAGQFVFSGEGCE